MPMVPFASEYPDIALKEAKRIIVRDRDNIPDGEYLFLDSYCEDERCDCRRVMVNVVPKDGGNSDILATINYGWEDIGFYKSFLGTGDQEKAEMCAIPLLDFLNYQLDAASDFLDIFEELIKDNDYVETFKRHYEMFKKTIKQKRAIENEVKKRYERKISRNEPCPCGSGKKYKKCCG